jgi:hypothetical protein
MTSFKSHSQIPIAGFFSLDWQSNLKILIFHARLVAI